MFRAIIRIPVSFLTLSIPRNINRLKPKEAFIIISKVLKINRQLPHITPHGFRYTHTSILIESATEINEILERLGGPCFDKHHWWHTWSLERKSKRKHCEQICWSTEFVVLYCRISITNLKKDTLQLNGKCLETS